MKTLEEILSEQKTCEIEIGLLKRNLEKLRNEEAEVRFSQKFPIGKRFNYRHSLYEITGYGYSAVASVKAQKVKVNGEISKNIQLLSKWDLVKATDENGLSILE